MDTKIKLTELEPEFFNEHNSGRVGIGIILNCPCGCDLPLQVPFRNPIGGFA